jgi:hypothetical protein
MVSLLNDPPTSYARPENIKHALGFKSDAVLGALLASPRLRPFLDARLTAMLGTMPEMTAEDRQIAEFLLNLTDDKFRDIARIIAVLTQARMIRSCVDGPSLAAVATFAGGNDILHFLRDQEVPVFSGVPRRPELTISFLQECAGSCECYLTALMPLNFQLRLLLHRVQGQLRGTLEIPGPDARLVLQALLETALKFLSLRNAKQGTDAVVHGGNDAAA